MKARQVGALVVGGIVGLGVLNKLVQRRRSTNGLHPSGAMEGNNHLSEEQADAFVSGLESATPPTGEERIRRQRELYEDAAKLRRPGRVRAAR